MNKKRLLKLADFIEKLPRKKFDMLTIISVDEDKLARNIEPLSFEECGTTACAMGWTPAVFPKLLDWYTSTKDVALKNKDLYNWEAMEELFDISERDSSILFSSGTQGYETPKEVAAGIRMYVETNGDILPPIPPEDEEVYSDYD